MSGLRRTECLRQAEVEDLDDTGRRDLDVGRLEIAVHDAFLMRRLERVGDLSRVLERLGHRDRSPRDPLRERLAFDEREHKCFDPCPDWSGSLSSTP